MKAIGYFDGACKLNPGEMGIGAVMVRGEKEVATIAKPCGAGTSNEAEWLALVGLLELASASGVDELEVRGDSQLVIQQMRGEWKVRAKNLQRYRAQAGRLLFQFRRVTFVRVQRRENKRADYLAMMSLRQK